MIKTENQLKTLILGIIAIVLCLVSVVGTTFALFTNDPNDGTIGVNVTSGKLAVDIIDTENLSLVGEVLDFHTEPEGAALLFEPGATYYTEGFRIKNNGAIPMNFRMYISEDDSIENEALDKAFDFFITKDPLARTNEGKLEDYKGELAVGEQSEIFYLVVQMKTDANNDFQNKTFTGIGITVYAVQGNVEIE